MENVAAIVGELKDNSEEFQLVDEEEEFQDLELIPESAPEFKVEECDDEPLLRPDLDEIMEKFDNPNKIKKSFEVKYQNDDDDEIFIVHDEEDDQDQFFVNENIS